VDYIGGSPPAITWEPNPAIYYIPSGPSTITRMSDAVTKLMDQVGAILTKLDSLTVGPVIDDLRDLIESVRTQVNDVRVGEIHDEAVALLKNLQATNTQMQDLLKRPEIEALLHGASATATDSAATAATARTMIEGAQGQVSQILEQTAEASRSTAAASARLDALLKTDDLPEAGAHLRNILRRVDTITTQQQESIETILENLRQVTENLREFSRTARDNPPQIIFGAPPAAPKLEGKK
jgi:ABC-type transporter Mla subunit MlaD